MAVKNVNTNYERIVDNFRLVSVAAAVASSAGSSFAFVVGKAQKVRARNALLLPWAYDFHYSIFHYG